MMDDPDYYKYALGISYAIPSAETLRQRFDMIGDSLRKDIQQANVDMLREMHIEPTALDNGFVPIDIDVTPFDNSKSNKEGVSRTYKDFDGYAPIILPSGKFESNKLVLELTMIAYNILRIIGQESLKKKDAPGQKKIHRRRIRTVISNLMQFAGHLTEHAGRLVLSIGRSNRWRFTFKRLYDSFAFIT